jgi:hypothetical protein
VASIAGAYEKRADYESPGGPRIARLVCFVIFFLRDAQPA